MAHLSIVTTKDHVKDHYALQGQDAVKLAEEYVAAWVAKVEPGTQTTIAKMKCALADEPCGCAPDSTNSKCMGPNPPVPVEILLEVLESPVEGVQVMMLPSTGAFIDNGHVHYVEFGGSGVTMYLKKI
jgi:hypothetical protein